MRVNVVFWSHKKSVELDLPFVPYPGARLVFPYAQPGRTGVLEYIVNKNVEYDVVHNVFRVTINSSNVLREELEILASAENTQRIGKWKNTDT